MIKPEQIPEAVVYEVFKGCEWDTEREAAEAIAAALNAWPGMEFAEGVFCGKPYNDLILPLMENPDDKPEMVPEEAAHALALCLDYVATKQEWREAIAAALNAWPGMKACEEDDLGPACLILPLPPQEKRDDE